MAVALCGVAFGPLLPVVHAFGPGGHYGWLAESAATGTAVDHAPVSPHEDGDAAKCGTCAQLSGQRMALASTPVTATVQPRPLLASCEQEPRAPECAPRPFDPARGPPRSS